jgi:hypothetical protein
MDYVQLFVTSLLSLAGSNRLPPKLSVKDESDPINQHEANIKMERNVQDYIISVKDFGKKLHDAKNKNKFLSDINTIINESESVIKNIYAKLWENFLNNSTNNKENIELMDKLMEKMLNKKLKTEITNNNRTPSKIKNSLKTILNISPPFTSIFVADVLDKKEQMILNSAIQKNVVYTNNLDGFLSMSTFNQDEDMTINMFYNEISKITDSKIRTDYYNMIMEAIVSKLTVKVGNDIKLLPIDTDKIKITERIFAQVYLYFINFETIKVVSDKVKRYIDLKKHQWYTYQITEFPTKLCPNWVFKPKGFHLDSWQKNTIKAVDKKQNILLSLPTSAGKTIVSTYVIRSYNNVVYLVPSISLAYQLTGIILASLHDRNDEVKNVRLETEGMSFKKYPSKEDNIIVATPIEFYTLLANKLIEPNFDYIIFDEFHNLSDLTIGPYIEYILKFAGYFNISIMALSATIPNFSDLKDWLEKIMGQEVYGVYEEKRFYQLKRFIVKNSEITEINLLEHMNVSTLMNPEFKQIGLYPKDFMNLKNQVMEHINMPELQINESIPDVVSLDRLHITEGNIFKNLKTQPKEILEKIFSSNTDVNMKSLTVWSLYNVIKDCKNKNLLPMLIFKMDATECLEVFTKMLSMLKEYQSLVYPNYNGVNKIIKNYYETLESEEKKLKVDSDKYKNKSNSKKNNKDREGDDDVGNNDNGNSDSGPKTLEELKENLMETLFEGECGVKSQLKEWYTAFINTKIEPTDIEKFNTSYGSNLNEEEIITLRKKHSNRELKIYNRYENLRVRNVFQSHPECRFMSTAVSYDEMKKIKTKINAEITRDTRIKKGLHAPINKINYDHPFMVGIEYGILCYCNLIDPAMQRVCQQLINTYPFVTFSDKSLAVGINYPIKTVMLLGTIGEDKPLEIIDNTLAHQACGRAGRRGNDKEGNIIYAGIDIKNIIIPKYTIVKRNSVEHMTKLINEDISDNFKNFILNEIRPEESEPIWKCINSIDIDKLAEEMYNMQTVKDVTLTSNVDEDEYENTIKTNIKSLEQIKAELVAKINFKPKVSIPLDQKVQLIDVSSSESHVNKEDEENILIKVEIDFSQFENWEDAYDAMEAEKAEKLNKELKESKAAIANAESSFM